MKKLSIEEKVEAYDKVSKEVKDFFEGKRKMCSDVTKALEDLFPELKESEDEKIRKELLAVINDLVLPDEQQSRFVAWLEKHDEQKPNPYSGVSFEYNGHTWGMCARDGGVDIGYDKQLIANINPIREKDEFDNFSKVVDNKPIGYNTGDFIMCTAPNCN